MAAEMHTTSLRVSRLATNAMRLMLVSRSSRLNPSPLLKCVRTISPSRISTLHPRSFKRCSMISERVLFPEPESPVNQIVKPLFAIYGILLVRLGDHLRRATQGSPLLWTMQRATSLQLCTGRRLESHPCNKEVFRVDVLRRDATLDPGR